MSVTLLYERLHSLHSLIPGGPSREPPQTHGQKQSPSFTTWQTEQTLGTMGHPSGSLVASKHARKRKTADRAQAEVALTSRAASRSAPRSSMTRTTSLWPICDAIHRGAVPSFKRKKGAEKFGVYIMYSQFDCQNLPTGMDELQLLNKILRHGWTNAESLPEARGSSLYEIRTFLGVE